MTYPQHIYAVILDLEESTDILGLFYEKEDASEFAVNYLRNYFNTEDVFCNYEDLVFSYKQDPGMTVYIGKEQVFPSGQSPNLVMFK